MGYAHHVKPGSKVDLDEIKTDPPHGIREEDAREKTQHLRDKLEKLQELIYAASSESLLIVLQGRDTAGKDGTIRHLSTCMNVQHTNVTSFKQPTAPEAGHDFLWRVHAHTPRRGQIAIFNRSHYEDVLVVRVHDLISKKEAEDRFDDINRFEDLLRDSNSVVLKFMLHISKEEQEKRLFEREADPSKAWKLSAGDWRERKFWDDYTKMYEEALEATSTKHAPWYVIPADHKWYRDLCITEAIVDALEPYEDKWKKHLEKIGEKAKAELSEFRLHSK